MLEKAQAKFGKWFYAFVAATVLLIGALIAMTVVIVNASKDPVIPPEGPETGVYYYDAVTGEYTISLNSGNKFTISGPDLNKSGEYTADGNNLTFDFIRDEDGTTTATIDGENLAFVWNGATMNFLKKVSYTITFNTNGGNAIDNAYVVNGKLVTKPSDPNKDGNVFLGWYADEALTTAFNFGATAIKADTTVYAKWAEKSADAEEYEIDFVLGFDSDAPASITTIGGKLAFDVDYVEPTREGYTFEGWYVSVYDDAEKLTYKATEGTVIDGNTTLYAVWSENTKTNLKSPDVSVNGNTISWSSVEDATSYSIVITDSEGNIVAETSVGTTTYTCNFSAMEEGTYTISVIAKGNKADSDAAVRYINNKALGKVTQFQVIDGNLIFNAVAGAEKYLITIICGNSEHNHTKFDNGNSTVYNFSGCTMQPGGIKFVVTAVATGRASSTSKEFVYERNLDKIDNINYDAATATFTWKSVIGASNYIIKITDANGNVSVVNTANTFVSVKSYTGSVSIEVVPTSTGYNSPAAATATIVKNTPATPTNVTVNGMFLSWSDTGVEKYAVKINGSTYYVENATEYDLRQTGLSFNTGTIYSITVQSIGATDTSAESDALAIKYLNITNVYYNNNTVSWDPAIGITKYEVQVNDEPSIIVESTSAVIKLTKSGINTISVKASGFATNAEWVTINVYAYAVTYDSRSLGGSVTEYVAKGDTMLLPTDFTLAGFDFTGWYNTPGGASGNGAQYAGTVFTGNGDTVLYANWTPKTYYFLISGVDATMSGAVDGEKIPVVYTKDFTLPVMTTTDIVNGNFAGWYTGPGGTGTKLTDYLGNSVAPYNVTDFSYAYPYFTSGVIFILNSLDNTYSVKMGHDVDTIPVITIPAYYNNIAVTTILENGFYNCDRLVEINIPDTIQLIGTGAFNSCDALKAINVYEVATETPHEVFYSSYDGALLFEDPASGVTYLELFPRAKKGAFTIPETVDVIRNRAFNYAKISSLTISKEVYYIGDYAFSNCRSLTEIFFEEGGTEPTSIVSNAFYGCYSVTYIKLPALIKGKGDTEEFNTATLDYLTALEVIEVEKVAGAYFSDVSGMLCSELGDTIIYCPKAYTGISGVLRIPNGITAISNNTFANRNAFTEIIIPNYVTDIGSSAFSGCRNVTKITLEGGRSRDLTIGTNAFYGCSNVRTIDINGGNTLDTGKITIGSSAFSGLKELRNLNVAAGANITTIGNRAFYQDLKLRNINIDAAATIETINSSAFYGCEGLVSFTIPATTVEIGDYAFANCSLLKTIIFAPNGQDISFGSYVFSNCVALTEVELPATVKSFDGSAFDGCYSLKTIKVDPANTFLTTEGGILYDKNKTEIMFYPKGINDPTLANLPWDTLTTIGTSVFKDNTNITSVVIPSTITKIGDGAFNGCINITSITIENGGTTLSVGGYAFANLPNVSTIVLPSYTTYIGDGAFYLTNLTEFTIPENVTYIGSKAFMYTKLTTINIPAKVTMIGDGAFAYSSLKTITFEEGNEPLTIGSVKDTTVNYAFESLDYNVYSSAVVFPEGYIDVVATGVFRGTSVKNIEFPARVESIGVFAFYEVTSLNTVTFPEGSKLNYISDGAFIRSGLTSINLENTVVTTIGEFAFTECKLTAVKLPNTIQLIEKYAFSDNGKISSGTKLAPSLKTVEFADGGKAALTIKNEVFRNSVIETITFPANLTACDDTIYVVSSDPNYQVPIRSFYTMFTGNVTLREVNVSEGCQNYASKDGIFYAKGAQGQLETLVFCPPAKTGEVVIPNTVTKVESRAFYVSQLSKVTFEEFAPGSENYGKPLLTLGNAESSNTTTYPVFGGTMGNSGTCTAYTYRVNTGAKKCYNASYLASSKIVEINFPSHLDVLNSHSVYALKEKDVHVNFNMDATISLRNYAIYLNYNKENDGSGIITLNLPKVASLTTNSWSSYTVANNRNMTTLTFAEGSTVDMIPYNGFSNNYLLESFEIPASVTYIDENAFYNCKNLKNITFAPGSKIQVIQDEAFSQTGLTEFVFPDSVTNVGEQIFLNCAALKKVTIGMGIVSILAPDPNGLASSAFRGCTTIEEYIVPKGHSALTAVDGVLYDINQSIIYAYPVAKDYTDFVIPETVKEISNFAFTSFKGSEIQLPSHLTTIGYGAFYSSFIQNITIPASVTKIDGYAFAQSSGSYRYLKTITFEPGSLLTYIGQRAFIYGTFEEINIPDNVSYIGNSAIYSVNKLKSLILPAALTEITQSMVAYNSALTSVTIQNNVKVINNQSFQGNSKVTSLHIPASVTAIGLQAFYNNTSLKTVTFDEDSRLTSIAYQVFQNCSKLESITLPGGISELGLQVFAGCTNLKYVDMSETQITTLASSTGSTPTGFFNKCTSLETVLLPETLESIEIYCFKGCTKLSSIYIPASVTFIGDGAFDGCTKLASVEFGRDSALKALGSDPEKESAIFRGTTALKSITLPEAIEVIGGNIFENSGLETVTLPESLNTISVAAFKGCKNLVEVEIPETVMDIHDSAFQNCENIEVITMNEGIEYIGSDAFGNCSKIKSIMIPSTVLRMGGNPFSNCTGIESFELHPENESFIRDETGVLYDINVRTVIFYPASSTSESYTMPDTVFELASSAFAGSQLKSIVISDNIKVIPDGCFKNSALLESVSIPLSVTSIGNEAFYGCASLDNVALPSSTTSLGDYAFKGCSSLKNFDFGERATSLKIGKGLFTDCTSYSDVVLGDSISAIPEFMFAGTGIVNLVIPETVTDLSGEGLFMNCTKLETVEIPDSVEGMLGVRIFSGCTSLKEVTIPDGIWSLGEDWGEAECFMDCTSLETVNMESGNICYINDSTFKNCTSLVNLNFDASSLEFIGYNAFENCAKLEVIDLSSCGDWAYVEIYDNAFKNCSSLHTFLMPLGFLDWLYDGMFEGCNNLKELHILDLGWADPAPFRGWTSDQTIYFDRLSVYDIEDFFDTGYFIFEDCEARIFDCDGNEIIYNADEGIVDVIDPDGESIW